MLTLALGVGGLASRWKRRLAWLLYRRADGCIAISHPVAADLLGGYRVPADRAFVVPNPVVTAAMTALVPAASTGPPLHLVFVGRLVPRKRVDVFVATVESLLTRGIAVRATVVGDGPTRPDLEALAAQRSLPIVFKGWCEQWWAAVPDADCLVLPSEVEGFGNVLIEAAAAGIPAVASSRSLGVADALIPGITGELAAGVDADLFADAVLRAVDRERPAPVQRWLARFSVEESTTTLLTVLESLVSRSRAAL